MYQYPKKILSIEEQIQSYINADLIIESEAEVENVLRTIGYYRLRGYSSALYDNRAKKYKSGTKFEDIVKLYWFDQKLSNLILSMIFKIEVALRVRLVEALLIHKDALILKDSSIFKNKKLYWKNMSVISSEIARSKDLFIKHHFKKYDGEIPVWATVEVISFGTLSKIISNLKTDEMFSVFAENYKYKSKRGNFTKPSQDMLASWIQSVSVLRNICAHNSRIYNRTITIRPEIPAVDKTGSEPKYNGLYQVLLAMKYLRSSDKEWKEFVDELASLIQDYDDVINLSAMNIPADWESYLCVE